MNVTSATRAYALLGDPVGHSLSPRMQNAAIRAAGVDAVYIAIRCGAESVAPLIHAFALAGGGGNVTIPHKTRAAATLDRSTDAVIATGACNTFWLEDGRVTGDNTDVHGFEAAARQVIGPLNGVHACVLGAGGAARAVVHAVLRSGGEATVLGRTSASLEAMEARFGADPRLRTAAGANPFRAGAFDLLVNATPVGMAENDPIPTDLDSFPALRGVIDLVVRQGGTRLTRAAALRGVKATDGLPMLIAQGEAAFERWFGADAPTGTMLQALRS